MPYKFLDPTREKISSPNKPVLFIVEGMDDGLILENLLDERQEDPSLIQIIPVGGKEKLSDYLAAFIKSPIFVEKKVTHIAMIIDADEDFLETQKRFQEEFAKNGLGSPASGEIQTCEDFKSGIYILPNSRDSGELEDLAINIFKEDKRIIDAANLLERHQSEDAVFKKPSKRIVQISLALSHSDLCAGIGRGVRNGAFKLGILELEQLNKFITALFSDKEAS